MAFNEEGLRKAEDKIFEDSRKYILSTKEGEDNYALFETTMDFLDQILLDHTHLNDDELTVQFIGARLFNHGALAFRNMLSGYYQTGFLLIGDMIEMQFLLDYVRSHPEKIEEWKGASNKERKEKFAPYVLYQALDKRDGFTGERRKKAYQEFCEYARHVTYPGMALIAKGKEVQVGPFYDAKKLRHGLIELNRRLGHAAVSLAALLPVQDLPRASATLNFMKKYGKVLKMPIPKGKSYREVEALVRKLGKEEADLP